jgi:phage terminase small subunit
MKDIKFPLFYPTFKEVKNIIENNTKLMIENHEIKTVDLTESSTDEILGFIKGFAHNSLIGVLGREKLNKVYDKLKQNIENDIEHIRKDQWNHCILELKTDI